MSEDNKESRITEEQVRSLLAVDNQVWTFSDGKMAKWFMSASSALRQYLDDLERKSETDVRIGEFMEQAIHDFEMRCDDEAVSVLRKICDIASGKNSCGGGGSCAHCTMESSCSSHKKEGSSSSEDELFEELAGEENGRFTAKDMSEMVAGLENNLKHGMERVVIASPRLIEMLRQAAKTEELYQGAMKAVDSLQKQQKEIAGYAKKEAYSRKSYEEADDHLLSTINSVCQKELNRLDEILHSTVENGVDKQIVQEAVDSIILILNYVSGYERENETIVALKRRIGDTIEQLEGWSSSLGKKIGYFDENIKDKDGVPEVLNAYKRLTGQKDAIDSLIKIAKGEIIVHHGGPEEE